MAWSNGYLDRLERHLNGQFPAIRACYDRSETVLGELSEIVGERLSGEVSFVTFGSLARKEYNSGSDLDWSLMVDGKATTGHRELERHMRKNLRESGKFKNPNPAGAFGGLTFGHDVIHCIGGMYDTNANLTRRLLLLLESAEPSNRSHFSPRLRIMRGILQRYFEEESHFPGKDFFPRFFLNDVVRYWRTIAVDYAAKNSERGEEGWALRNAKLRFSRKLLYVAGLLLTYETTLFPQSDLIGTEEHPSLPFDIENPALSSTEHCFQALKLTPLELLARACLNLDLPKDKVNVVFEKYDRFLEILDTPDKRSSLAALTFEQSQGNAVFQEIRKLGHSFRDGVEGIFLAAGTKLGDLTLSYGVF